MLTILAIDKKLLCEMDDFETVFQNVSNKGDFKICSWNREGKTLFEAIPALFDRHFVSECELRNWNIIIVSDDRLCISKNPFGGDYINDKDSLPDPEINEVAKMLGIVPTDSHMQLELPDNKFGSLKWNIDVSRSLRDEKLKQYNVLDFSRPKKIFLFSVVKKADSDIDEVSEHIKSGGKTYFDFRTTAKYPVNCRFMKFNLSSISNRNTKEDFFRLWITLLILAYNDIDSIYLAPDVLYNVSSEFDKKILRSQISDIYSQAHFIKKNSDIQIKEIIKERENLKSKHYDVPNMETSIEISFKTNEDGLFLNNKRFGLASDCPCKDQPEYKAQRLNIERRIINYLKVPKRAVKRAVLETKRKGEFITDSPEKIHLDENQTEDLIENIDSTELKLFSSDAINYDYERINADARKATDEEIYGTMKRRSTVSAIVVASFALFFAVLVSFIPYIVNAFVSKNNETVTDSFMITFGSILLFALAGFITLLILRIPLSRGLKKFKRVIKQLISDTKESAVKYSDYLSKLSTFMKNNSFKTYLDSEENIYKQEEENRFRKNSAFAEKKEEICRNWAEIFNFNLKYSEKHIDKYFVLDDYPERNPIYSFVLRSGDYRIKSNGRRSDLISPYEFITSFDITLEEDV